ncbi:MAG: rod shape-determining protein MreC [Acidobacteria bacterium]|nr:rod shape-determining protein MreC [Acidobacteriota bacterium]
MEERRTAWLLIALLVAQLLLVASQVPATGGGKSRLEAGALLALAPVARAVATLSARVQSVGDWFSQRRTLRQENERLRIENRQLSLQLLRLTEAERRLENLSRAVHYVPPDGGKLQLADILYVDHSSWVRTLVLYVPEAGLEINQAVVTDDGLVGRVVLVAGPYAKVQLITDRAASIGAMVQRTRRQGLVQGTSQGELQLAFLPRQSDVRQGDRVVTSGIDGIFPRGIAIGTVISVSAGNDLFQTIRLASAVDFSKLDHAYVLERQALPQEVQEALPGEQP